jgi:hypothetical protein
MPFYVIAYRSFPAGNWRAPLPIDYFFSTAERVKKGTV